jgi:hypothetical protein
MTARRERRMFLPALLLFLSLLAPSRGWAHQAPMAVRDLTLMGLLTSWNFRAEVMLVLAVLAGAYTRGWWRLQKQGQGGPRGGGKRPHITSCTSRRPRPKTLCWEP